MSASPPPTTAAEETKPEQEQEPQPATGSPSSFLQTVVGNRVVVRLNSGVSYHGILNCLDGYMNIALEQTEEWVNGEKVNEYGDAFVRGNNVLYISKMDA